jgi:drug/metabolite transporter (DMT)-like permease
MSANSRGAAERSARLGLLLATAAATLWGTVGVASTMLPDGVTLSSFHLGFARLVIAAPLLVLFSALVLGRALWAIPARPWPWIAAVGVLAACYQFCLFVSLEQLRVARTALLTVCLPPVLIAGASALVSQQRPSAWTTGALLLALGGLMLVGAPRKRMMPSLAPRRSWAWRWAPWPRLRSPRSRRSPGCWHDAATLCRPSASVSWSMPVSWLRPSF